MTSQGLAREWPFLGTTVLVFMTSAVVTVYWCRSMSASMAMPGGWSMSMVWMRMPGQTSLGAAASFLAMWVVMMVAMMLPSFVPMLLRYRDSVHVPYEIRLAKLTTLVSAGYFFIWAIFGAMAYPFGLVSTAAEIRWPAFARSVPIVSGVVLLLAGCIQLTAWKARQLGRCQDVPTCGRSLPADARSAWQYGLGFGVRCTLCCLGFMTILLVIGVMNLVGMLMITSAITIERLSPKPQSFARAIGVGIIAVGALAIIRALGVT
ncbi:MAG TPA: DUF2182 domain-containing protein [Terriglobales bacterium]|nr:DUF2182 domain-containing protein [Terriglobales bacterium]